MKKTLLIVALLGIIAISSSAQGKWENFFGRVPEVVPTNDRGVNVQWLFRPVVQVSAMQFTFSDQVLVAPLSSLGTGLTIGHFTEQNGEPYMDYAFSAIVLFGTDIGEVSPAEISLAGTIQLWQYVSFGGGYNLSSKKFFILTGVAFNFN
ncbi:MAG: hypothetical protein BWY95_00058 [Bacteroidetes bacterium ADurb.BinA104]|nr:MAG: hypothetical protein BWY95_00058 [Bacteroidetes bacterium ADurb.BinA104]